VQATYNLSYMWQVVVSVKDPWGQRRVDTLQPNVRNVKGGSGRRPVWRRSGCGDYLHCTEEQRLWEFDQITCIINKGSWK